MSLKSHFLFKTDTSENWELEKNFVPLKGELCIYSDFIKEETTSEQDVFKAGLKIGTGNQKIKEIPFIFNDYITSTQIVALFSEQTNTLGNFKLGEAILG